MMSSLSNELNLTRFSPGSLKELLALVTPFFLILFSTSFLGFLERIWFSHLSTTILGASINAVYVLKLFQVPCIALVMMGQAFVGYYFGAQEKRAIGPCIWQLVWFSLLATFLVVPLSFLVHWFYFKGTEIEEAATSYFFILSFCNFLFPLASAFSCFYFGRGRTHLITIATLVTVFLNAGLDVLLIFGVDPWIPPLGLKGAAWASVISQGLFCGGLLLLFLSPSNQRLYSTHQWQFKPRMFWHYISPALPRALGRLVMMIIWTANIHIMISKGGNHLLVLTVGGTISLFLTFLGDGLLQALTVLISNALGQKNDLYIQKILRSSFIFIAIIGSILAIPLIVFPHHLLSLFALTPTESLIRALFWVWFNTMIYILSVVPLSFLMAYKETLLLLIANLGSWITGYLPVYLGINILQLSPDKFWLLASSSMIAANILYFWQIMRKKWLYPSLQQNNEIPALSKTSTQPPIQKIQELTL